MQHTWRGGAGIILHLFLVVGVGEQTLGLISTAVAKLAHDLAQVALPVGELAVVLVGAPAALKR